MPNPLVHRHPQARRAVMAALLSVAPGILSSCSYNEVLLPDPAAQTYDLLVEESDPMSNRVLLAVRDMQTGYARGVYGLLVDGGMPAVASDGSFIVFVGPSTGSSEYDYQDLWRLSRGGRPQRITLGEGPEHSPALSPDGQRIAYVKLDALGESRLWVANVDGSNERLVSPALAPGLGWRFASPSWSPDGTRLLFSAGEPGRLHLWTAKPDGTALQQVTDAAISDIDGAWSPDGQWVAFTRTAHPATSQIFIRNLATGAERMFAYSYRNRHPAWSPDGRRLAFVSNMEDNLDFELYTVRTDGEGLQRHTWDDLRQQSPRWFRR